MKEQSFNFVQDESDEPPQHGYHPQVPKDKPPPNADSVHGKHGVGGLVLYQRYTYSSMPYGARVWICRTRLL